MADGTIKQVNPFTDTEVWAVSGRAFKPMTNELERESQLLEGRDLKSYCPFCEDRLLETPPEKSRLIVTAEDEYHQRNHVMPEQYQDTEWLFRRVPNLFEIVTVD